MSSTHGKVRANTLLVRLPEMLAVDFETLSNFCQEQREISIEIRNKQETADEWDFWDKSHESWERIANTFDSLIDKVGGL
ncbi:MULTISPECIES: hypothetical protein [Shewanella]|uniref:hypothetical protein n=1 Tax=Shewanella TaxID=22 RepID=UPI00138F704B|nr:hypothetical protein [Shewanella sp. SE1]NDO76142.1 hypothetical protein [Shewanella sp. SE1]